MRKIPGAYCRFQNLIVGLEVGLCTKFSLDSSHSYGVIVPNVVLDLFALSDPKGHDGCPKMDRLLARPWTSVCAEFQVDSSKTFRVMLQKSNLNFVTSVTLKIKVTTLIQIS